MATEATSSTTELVAKPIEAAQDTGTINDEDKKEEEEERVTTVADNGQSNGDDSIPTAEFNAAVEDLRNALESGDPSKDFGFSPTLVTCTRRGFEVVLIWFCLLLLSWDVCIPIASIKAAMWTSDQQVVCSGAACDASCQALNVVDYDPDCKPGDRTSGDTPLFFNPQFRQEFGTWWVVLISFHVFAAWITFPSYFTQLFFTRPGRKFHKICGIVILLTVLVLWTFGGIAAVILVTSRSFHPCAYSVRDYNNANPFYANNGENTASSFPFYLYLQFAFDGALLNECLMHGIAARLFYAMAFDPKYGYVSQAGSILRKWQAYALSFLSYSSLWLYVWRTLTMIVIVFVYWSNQPGADDANILLKHFSVKTGEESDVSNACVINDEAYLFETNATGIYTQQVPAVTSVTTVTEKMCIARGTDYTNQAYASEVQVYIMMGLFIAQLFLIPMVQLPNLRARAKHMEMMQLHSEMQGWKDEAKIKKTILLTLREAAIAHGSNLTVAGFVTLWTFLANVGYVFAEFLIATSYVGGILGLMMWYFCKCQVVRPCPPPYNDCCCACCYENECCGWRTCPDLCSCLVPPNSPYFDREKVLKPRFGPDSYVKSEILKVDEN